MKPELLYCVVPYFNPIRWESRGRLQKNFEEHMLDSGVNLTTVECALGARPFVLSESKLITRIQVRSKTILWTKENLINIGFAEVSRNPDAKYFCWPDGDLTFRNQDWASETVHALQHYDVVQPWEHAYDLGPNNNHMAVYNSWCRQYHYGLPCVHDGKTYDYAHPGYAWACTRDAFNHLGGLMEFCIMGSADYHMAMGLINKLEPTNPGAGLAESYNRELMSWQDKANTFIKGNIGFVPGTIEHSFHGPKVDRKYNDRWSILRRNKYDLDHDIKKNSYGVIELSGNKPGLRSDLDHYFRQRNEDANVM